MGAIVLVALVVFMAIDLVTEPRPASSFHVVVEGAAIAAALIGALVFARRVRELSREAQDLRCDLATSRADAARWAREARGLIDGLSAAIDEQLERWRLSSAEKEVALLLLKGLEHKQIAELRGVSETTVRQQARSLYRKAGLGGRHELAAFFLEDLLGPRPDLRATGS